MFNITAKEGEKLTLSQTRLTETVARFGANGNKLKTRRTLRFVLLKDLKQAFTDLQAGLVTPVPTTYHSGTIDNHFIAYGAVNYGQQPGELSIGCIVFTQRTSNKILRTAGVKLSRKVKSLAASV